MDPKHFTIIQEKLLRRLFLLKKYGCWKWWGGVQKQTNTCCRNSNAITERQKDRPLCKPGAHGSQAPGERPGTRLTGSQPTLSVHDASMPAYLLNTCLRKPFYERLRVPSKQQLVLSLSLCPASGKLDATQSSAGFSLRPLPQTLSTPLLPRTLHYSISLQISTKHYSGTRHLLSY